MPVPFFELRDFPVGIEAAIQGKVMAELAEKRFVLGPAVEAFEEAFAAYVQVPQAVGVGNGYDALVLSLKALGIGPGDEVLLPGNTYIATINAVQQVGAKPVLVEPDASTYNLSLTGLQEALTPNVKAILPVHLYGQTCDMPTLMQFAQEHGLLVVEDCAQAHGAEVGGQKVGTFGQANAFSFYPTKNLGALGDGGAVTTNNPEVAAFLRQYRNYGQSERYLYEVVGVNSRLDSLQAAVLSVKLQHLQALNAERQLLAGIYLQELQEVGDLILPETQAGCGHVYHLFVVRTARRDQLQQYLQTQGITTLIHYPVPAHLQASYAHLGLAKGDLPLTEELALTSVSLPLFPGMTSQEQAAVIIAIKKFFS
ncbi:aminotransferase class I/II-fold pyridoxal phosphate-dependent enzyme [Nibribacter ruber]|uniref:Aminotransferase class I/II-fold pyridoxal phosphate-dependent enzyme n=1 Tax=Nibribacter ruber TaxID=2698458 RepID=A0A6P1NZG8_9BACT|nr:DegT/DnrJ/EryC1/StrS family aminotransferase [Nibribacter ruber]QHL87301.1 aminotransferase class I/II-fold pyridoxal phosphate-dependent enzyme [Nibribacter ruber]